MARVYDIGNNTDSTSLQLRSTACHSLPLRNIEWRTTDDPAE